MTADTQARDTGHDVTLPNVGPSAEGGEARDTAASTGMPVPDPRESAAASLLAARRARGWSLDDLSGRTRISVERLAEIEQGCVDNCGAAVYARGHLRAVANALQIDPQPLLDALVAPSPTPAPDASVRVHRPAVVLSFLVVCLLALLVLGLGLALA
ncbi:MAG: helix-turn-helix domain-containing protein [Frankiaceae bacterium]